MTETVEKNGIKYGWWMLLAFMLLGSLTAIVTVNLGSVFTPYIATIFFGIGIVWLIWRIK